MCKVAFLSDVNANIEALQAVFSDIIRQGGDTLPVVFLGDGVGYGADPIACVKLLRNQCDVYLRGYLEHHLANSEESDFPSDFLRETLSYAKHELLTSDDQWSWLCVRPLIYSAGNVMAMHTEPRGVDYKPLFLETIRHSQRLRNTLFPLFSRLLLVGGNHASWVATEDGFSETAQELNDLFEVPLNQKTIVSVGSVGQSRNGDPRACYAIASENSVQWRRVGYDVDKAAGKIEETYQLGKEYAHALIRGQCT